MTNTYTTDEFLKRLNDGALLTPLTCEGFAKPVEGSREAFLFSSGTSCENWIKIPREIIEKVEFLGRHSCLEHSHPLIRIHFKEPPANEPFAVVFSSLLRALNPAPINPQVMMLPIGPFIGEWMARLFADAVWYRGYSGRGGQSPADIIEGKMCIELRRLCRRGNRKACQLLLDEC